MNPSRLKYYEVFGLTEKATKSEVKRAYRKLAMKFHPDRNPDPKAHKLFLDLTEAYQVLMDDHPVPKPATANPNQPRNEKTEDQRIREAKERLKQQNNRIRLQQEYYFRKMTSGARWKIFRITAYAAAFIACVLLIEPFLPTHFEEHTIVAYSGSYNGLEHSDIRYLKTDRDLRLFVSSPPQVILRSHPQISVERSFWMRNPVRLWYQTMYSKRSYPIDFSIANIYPLTSVLLLLPAFTLWYKRKAYYFVMLYYFSQYIVGGILLYILFSQDRWAHLVTFGLL